MSGRALMAFSFLSGLSPSGAPGLALEAAAAVGFRWLVKLWGSEMYWLLFSTSPLGVFTDTNGVSQSAPRMRK